jgi:NAD(P)-dependent dehydrogenase (short-subunit alcohol dehydrogenase family)
MFSLAGKHVVVTGGGRGIGRGIARAMTKAGANVTITGRTASVLEETAEELRGLGGKVKVIVADVTSFEGIHAMVEGAREEFGYIHCWINNAGSANPADVTTLFQMDEGQWDRVVDLNLKWAFFAAQAAARQMTEGGSIVNVTSRAASMPAPNNGQYGAAKAGLENLTKTMATEWGHKQIRVNAIQPGVVLVENSSGAGNPGRQRRQRETVPLQRLGHVDDVGPLAVYFASDESSWITGTIVPVNGGGSVTVGLLTYLWKRNQEFEAAQGAPEAAE